MPQSEVERDFTNKQAAFGLRYALGCAFELTFAVWLLVRAESHRPLSTWLAYYLLAQTGACVLFGFWWYCCWAYERNATPWYLAGAASLVGAAASLVGAACVGLDRLFAFGFEGWDVALSFNIIYFAVGYCPIIHRTRLQHPIAGSVAVWRRVARRIAPLSLVLSRKPALAGNDPLSQARAAIAQGRSRRRGAAAVSAKHRADVNSFAASARMAAPITLGKTG